MEAAISLRNGVKAAYSEAARRPVEKHPFPVGREFAESVGYPADWLDELPPGPAEVFAGVSNVGMRAPVAPGMTVMDLGCGGGLDSHVLLRRMGGAGRIFGIDFSEDMLRRTSGIPAISAAGEGLPLRDCSLDLAVVNGIFNLNPFRDRIFKELARVLRPGGRVFGAELVLNRELPVTFRAGEANWFS